LINNSISKVIKTTENYHNI